MNQTDDTPGITYSASLPLSWRMDGNSAAMHPFWRQKNIDLLRALATLEAAPLERDHEADSHLGKALERLEAKVDVMLTMLAQIAAQGTSQPAPVPVILGVRQIEWRSQEALPEAGDLILISLHLSPQLPEPLLLPARVRSAAAGSCVAELLDMDAELKEWTTRTLFRYHRRALQIRRSQ